MTFLTDQVLVASVVLFSLGVLGFLTRRSLILMFLSLELMLASASLSFVAFGRHHGNDGGQMFAILILTVAACEAALALSLIVVMHRSRPTLDAQAWTDLHEAKRSLQEPSFDEDAVVDETQPSLTPAGLDPRVRPASLRFTPNQEPADTSSPSEVTLHG
jgi:NADH-quinone oxidoreductase subunit K